MKNTKRILLMAALEARLEEIDTTEDGNIARAKVYGMRNYELQPGAAGHIHGHIMANPLHSLIGLPGHNLLPSAPTLRGSSENYWYVD